MKQNRITRTVTFSKEGIDEMKRQAEAERLPVSRYLERLVWAKAPTTERAECDK